MKLTDKVVIKPSHQNYRQIRDLCHLSKNLYNASLYDVRQHYFDTKKYKTWQTQRPQFSGANPDYCALPAKIAGEVLRDVARDFSSFFALLKKKKSGTYNKNVRLPRYKKKDGTHVVTVPKDALSKKVIQTGELYKHTICPSSLNVQFMSRHKDIVQVKIVPKNGYIVLHIIYEVPDTSPREDNHRYLSIDPGVNNFATVVTNTGDRPLVYSGGAIKSTNQYYNKKRAQYMSLLMKNNKEVNSTQCRRTSKRIQKLTYKRNNKINWFIHQISSSVVNYAVSHNINTVIVGYNNNWKQNITLGKRNNQNFVQIPFMTFVSQLEYKCARSGLRFIVTEESYTSKCSFLDRESVRKHSTYVGKRVHRGLFTSSDGHMINADVNGAYNIMRKVVPDEYVYTKGIEDGAVHPVKVKYYSS